MLVFLLTFTPAHADTFTAKTGRFKNEVRCPQNWHTAYGAKILARCEAELYGAPWERVRCIGQRESGWQWDDRNSRSSASGLFQFLAGTWASERPMWAPRFHASVFSGRSNAVVAIRMMAHGIWSPWASTDGPC